MVLERARIVDLQRNDYRMSEINAGPVDKHAQIVISVL